MPTRTFADRLRNAREAAQLTLDAVGRSVGVTAQAVYRWEKGGSMPSSDKIGRLARVLNVSPDYLLTGTDVVRQTGNHSVSGGRRTVPVYMPTDLAAGNFDNPIGHAATHFPCGPDAYAVTLWDSSNAPAYLSGDQVVIDPELEPEPGDMVLAIIDGKPLFAKYATASSNGTRHIELQHLNPDWARHSLSEADARTAIQGVMTEHARPRRR